MVSTSVNILDIIPQRPPLVMVEKLVACDEMGAKSTFTISEDNVYCIDGKFTEAGIIENIAQTAAAQAGYLYKQKNIPVPIGFIGAVKNLEINSYPESNSEIVTQIKIENEVFGVTLISATIYHNENLVASAEMKIVIKKDQE